MRYIQLNLRHTDIWTKISSNNKATSENWEHTPSELPHLFYFLLRLWRVSLDRDILFNKLYSYEKLCMGCYNFYAMLYNTTINIITTSTSTAITTTSFSISSQWSFLWIDDRITVPSVYPSLCHQLSRLSHLCCRTLHHPRLRIRWWKMEGRMSHSHEKIAEMRKAIKTSHLIVSETSKEKEKK
jgi:hypothetical protein